MLQWFKYIIGCLLLLLLGVVNTVAQKNDTLLVGKAGEYKILPYMQYVEDTSRQMPLNDAVKLFNNGKFKTTTVKTTFNAGITFSAFWFKFSVKNTIPEARVMVFSVHEKVDTLFLYQQVGSTIKLIAATGFGYNYNTRPIPNRNFLFKLNMPPNGTSTYYLWAKNNADYVYMPFALKDVDVAMVYETNRYQLLAIYCGIFLFVIAFNIFLFFSLKYKLHLWYALYVLVCMVYLMMEDGITYEFILKNYPSLRWLINEEYWWYGLIILWLYVMQLIINQTRCNSIFFIPIKVVMAVLGIRVLAAFATEFAHVSFNKVLFSIIFNMGDIAFFVACVLLIASIIEKIVQKSKEAVYYLVATSFGLLGTLNIYFNYLGITNINFIEPNAMVVGLTIEISILTFILTIRYNNYKKQKERLLIQVNTHQKNLLEQIVSMQEQERKRLGADLHDDVGSSVTRLHLFVSNHFMRHSTNDENELHYRNQLALLLQNLVGQVRNVAHELMPKNFDEKGFIKTLIEKIQFLNKNQSLYFELLYTGNFENLSMQVQITCYRIIVELLNNIIKHAKATKSTIQLNCDESNLQIIVEDDGIGLDKNNQVHGGIGLKSIESRISYLQGTINYDSSKLGTTIVIEIPLTT